MRDIWTIHTTVQLLMALLGSAGFAMMFHLRRHLLIVASLGGLFSWFVYLAFQPTMRGDFLPAFVASACGAFYAEILARRLKVPSTPFFVVAMIPLIPGRTLYYAMDQMVHGYLSLASAFGIQTMQCALGIGGGMSIAWSVCDLSRKIQKLQKQNKPDR